MHAAHDSLSLRRYGPSPGSHAHDHFQVLLGLEGTLELEVDGRAQRIAAGGGCVIAPGALHDFEAPASARCLVLDTTHSGWAHIAGAPALPAAAQALAHYLQLALTRQDSLAQHYGPLLLLDCWRTSQTRPTRSQRRIDWTSLTQWCERQLHTPLTVADLAQQVFLSPTQFAVRCQQETGMRPMQWLRDLRLQRARQLRAQGQAMADIAGRCGYQSASALTAALRHHTRH
ncbi:MAG: AraC family transcriptional regulator [Curvibacter sp. RIFCSPHIGHO2_12_FULL_63_18]|uniref:AraC family transcriptional regulator n=1 Tax=Rhodoferax sp. TaxID=50421 RepID=UPI0008B931BD|nr:AraC family transcriptional regulator [Rhodoferax sp.]OGO97522.1 MAG: AraC family transcriptional regulator [Curvibacter sp. GWA2_63_95]OGO98733.1 MAG: AraC family transcriptional regulator [Curvibacter sp. RIFCSPHIGHO2_12_FULL_63_18]HCX81395.1 AraC family transcriptional regulator [Rhodoferax sp.]